MTAQQISAFSFVRCILKNASFIASRSTIHFVVDIPDVLELDNKYNIMVARGWGIVTGIITGVIGSHCSTIVTLL